MDAPTATSGSASTAAAPTPQPGAGAPTTHAPSTPGASSAGPFTVGAGLRERKRLVADAMSPGHMAAVAQAEPSSAERLRALVLAGLSKEARDRADQAETSLELTRCVRAFEAAVAEHEQLLHVLRDVAPEQDRHVTSTMQRTAQLETNVGAAVAQATAVKTDMEATQATLNSELSEYAQRMSVQMASSGERVASLETRTATNFARTEELFQRCDALLGEARASAAQASAAAATAAAAGQNQGSSRDVLGVAAPQSTFRAKVSDDGLFGALRKRVDDISRELLARQEVDVAVQLNLQQGTADTRALQECSPEPH